MEMEKMKLQRICADVYCRRKFTCHGECGIKKKIDSEWTCFCPECAKKTRKKYPDFFYSNSELCPSRFGDANK